MKKPNLDLIQMYMSTCQTQSDINELLPILYKYAEMCEHITEMGVRRVVSTYALMMGLPKKLISYDIISIEDYGISIDLLKKLGENNGVEYHFLVGDTTKIEIEDTDFLFIDTWHVYPQLKKELELHAKKVKKYIAFHDTTTFAYVGESGGHRGLWFAIEEFLDENKEWSICEKVDFNNGLTVLSKN